MLITLSMIYCLKNIFLTTDPYVSDFKVGDIVVLSSDIDAVKESFRNTGYQWEAAMLNMLGKKYPVLDVVSASGLIALPSPDGSANDKLYFSTSVISEQGNV